MCTRMHSKNDPRNIYPYLEKNMLNYAAGTCFKPSSIHACHATNAFLNWANRFYGFGNLKTWRLDFSQKGEHSQSNVFDVLV